MCSDEKPEARDLRSDVPGKIKLPGLFKATPPPVKEKPQKLPSKYVRICNTFMYIKLDFLFAVETTFVLFKIQKCYTYKIFQTSKIYRFILASLIYFALNVLNQRIWAL